MDLTNVGRITFGRAGKLYLDTGGSITTGAGAGNLAHTGHIAASSLDAGNPWDTEGFLLVGTLSADNKIHAGSILAGSLGTSSSNFIAAGGSFAKVEGVLSGADAQTITLGNDGGSASLGGSILIFNN
ncbi:MAG: hypothetical protein LBF80_06080 [Spirochaetaceae bacterium]|nr:hypothetical protein [Spirochaetaceae bacterium]